MNWYIQACVHEVEKYIELELPLTIEYSIKPIDLKSRNYIEIFAKIDNVPHRFVFPLEINIKYERAHVQVGKNKSKYMLDLN